MYTVPTHKQRTHHHAKYSKVLPPSKLLHWPHKDLFSFFLSLSFNAFLLTPVAQLFKCLHLALQHLLSRYHELGNMLEADLVPQDTMVSRTVTRHSGPSSSVLTFSAAL